VRIAIVIVSGDLRIRRFTPMAERVLNLIPGDIGRPIGQIKPNINCPNLERLIMETIDSVSVQQQEVQDGQGKWYSLSIRPYKNVDNRIDGAVLTLFDIDETRRQESQAQEARELAEAILRTVHEPVMVLDAQQRVLSVNDAFCRHFQVSEHEVKNGALAEVCQGQWNIPQLAAIIDQLQHGPGAAAAELTHDFPGLGQRTLHVQARRIGWKHSDGRIVLALRDPQIEP
jgi:two-component system CheB/CheR fusion protein